MRTALLLTLIACNDDGLTVHTTPPVVSILAPAAGAEVFAGEPVRFAATVQDAQTPLPDLGLVWTLDGVTEIDGVSTIAGDEVELIVEAGFPAGEHEIDLTAVDPSGESGSDQVTLSVRANAPPSVTFDTPQEGEVFLAGVSIVIDARVEDADESDPSTLALAWSGTVDVSGAPAAPGADGHALFFLDPGPGSWSLGLTATDPQGAAVTSLVTFRVVDGDVDDDGWLSDVYGGEDCDDSDAEVSPGSAEVCNDRDDDCDGAVDEGFDADGDGTADCRDVEECDGVDNDGDGLVDEDDAVDPSVWYTDADGDGYGVDTETVEACGAPPDTSAVAGDCDDGDARFHPGASEADCSDPADYNCDGSTAYADADTDGSPACEDCDDTDAGVNPGATEVCNGVDDDCDGTADGPDAVDATPWYADADGDTYGDPSAAVTACAQPAGHVADRADCDDGDAGVNPGATEVCDPGDTDEDCDGAVNDADPSVEASTRIAWYADVDADGYGDPAAPTLACEAPRGHVADATDCDDGAAGVHPGSLEVCNGVDDDCDGGVDEPGASGEDLWYLDLDGDGHGDPTWPTSACAQPDGYTAADDDCDDGDPAISPEAAEVCDGVDNDCDGRIDDDDLGRVGAASWYADADRDGYGDPAASRAACEAPPGFIGDASDCDDSRAAVNPAATEVCGGLDDDCDGLVDEDDPSIDATTLSTFYADADADGYGDAAAATAACLAPSGHVGDATDCDDRAGTVHPGATETCDDGVDQDCDGVDEVCPDVRFEGDVVALDVYSAFVTPGYSGGALGQGILGGQFTRDGLGDLLVSGRGSYSAAYSGYGSAHLLPGPVASGIVTDVDTAAYYNTNVYEATYWGQGLSPIGDVNLDGVDDFCVHSDDGDAIVDCWYGGDAAGTYTSPDFSYDTNIETIAAAGNTHGDTLNGSFLRGDSTRSSSGGTVFLSGPGLSYTSWTGTLGEQLGTALAGGRDYDGDGVDDVALGARYHDGAYTNDGAVYLLYGPAGGALADADARIDGPASSYALGEGLVNPGDVDGDGLEDLALVASTATVGADSFAGEVFVVARPPSGVSVVTDVSSVRLSGASSGVRLGDPVAFGDYDGDGTVDVLTSDAGASVTYASSGAVLLLYGPLGGSYVPATDADARLYGYASWRLGSELATIPDHDGDGDDELAIGLTFSGNPAVLTIEGL